MERDLRRLASPEKFIIESEVESKVSYVRIRPRMSVAVTEASDLKMIYVLYLLAVLSVCDKGLLCYRLRNCITM